MQVEMQAGKISTLNPIHLVMNVLGMTVFPFMAKPMIGTIFEVSDEQFRELMLERKPVILDFIKKGIAIN
jgi:hypothetical protein